MPLWRAQETRTREKHCIERAVLGTYIADPFAVIQTAAAVVPVYKKIRKSR